MDADGMLWLEVHERYPGNDNASSERSERRKGPAQQAPSLNHIHAQNPTPAILIPPDRVNLGARTIYE